MFGLVKWKMILFGRKFGVITGIALFFVQFFLTQIVFAQTRSNPENVKPSESRLIQQKAESVRKRGFDHLNAKEWDNSLTDFEEVLLTLPNDALSLYGKSLALFNLQRVSDAELTINYVLKFLSKTKTQKNLLADSLVLSAVISASKNKNSEAISKLEYAAKLVPKSFDAHFSLGRAYFGNGNIEKSIVAFRKAVFIQPKNIRAKFFLATALERDGRYDDALKEYRAMLNLDPDNAEGNLGLGVLLLKTEGDNSIEGLASLTKAVKLNGRLYEARMTLGKTLVRLNRAEESIEHLNIAAQLNPNNPEPHFQLGIAFRKLGMKSEAEKELEIVKKIHELRRGIRNPPQK